MPALFRTAALCGALLLCQTASAQLFRPADNAPPSPPRWRPSWPAAVN